VVFLLVGKVTKISPRHSQNNIARHCFSMSRQLKNGNWVKKNNPTLPFGQTLDQLKIWTLRCNYSLEKGILNSTMHQTRLGCIKGGKGVMKPIKQQSSAQIYAKALKQVNKQLRLLGYPIHPENADGETDGQTPAEALRQFRSTNFPLPASSIQLLSSACRMK
jgi:hypothetical protein